jgi:hypothetical protein
MIGALLTYQSDPNRETLAALIAAMRPIIDAAARSVAQKHGRWDMVQTMIAESDYRVVMAQHRLIKATFDSPAALEAWTWKTAKGAALDSLKRVRWLRGSIPWPDDPRDGVAEDWMHDRDRGDELAKLLQWVAETAQEVAVSDEERVAVNQVLSWPPVPDSQVAAELGISRSRWSERKKKALRGMAARIVDAADYEIDSLGRKLLGESWAIFADRQALGIVLYRGSNSSHRHAA